MDLTFVNGNDLQKSACQNVAHNLLNLPFDAIPLDLTIEFVDNPDPAQHNEFAATEWGYGSTQATIKIASIAPNWGGPYRGMAFLQEVFAHELGHAFYAALPRASRVVIAEMFGAASDDLDELQPSGTEWRNRIIEGIAETFKDAFLPARYRRFTNRTNKRISISRYPEFRVIFREPHVLSIDYPSLPSYLSLLEVYSIDPESYPHQNILHPGFQPFRFSFHEFGPPPGTPVSVVPSDTLPKPDVVWVLWIDPGRSTWDEISISRYEGLLDGPNQTIPVPNYTEFLACTVVKLEMPGRTPGDFSQYWLMTDETYFNSEDEFNANPFTGHGAAGGRFFGNSDFDLTTASDGVTPPTGRIAPLGYSAGSLHKRSRVSGGRS
jgi:hypothetical protein